MTRGCAIVYNNFNLTSFSVSAGDRRAQTFGLNYTLQSQTPVWFLRL